MKKVCFLIIALMSALSMNAQNGMLPAEVVPGSKGKLPMVAEIAPAPVGMLPILELNEVGFEPLIINGYVNIRADIRFPMVSEVGCDYYTIQYRNHGDGVWATLEENGNERHFDDRAVGMPMYIYSVTDYRLVIHGGEYDGYVSNVVTAYPISMYSRYTGWNESPTIEHCMVGIPVGDEMSFSAETYKDGKFLKYSTEENPDYFTYQWYRRNPNTMDMEAIAGATDSIYTPTLEDAGYQLVLDVHGDKVHADFMLRHPLNGVVSVPVKASVAYVGNDGFVLNTDYVVPNPEKMITRTISWSEEAAEFDPSCISERKPGEVAFRMPLQDCNYGIFDFTNPAYFLTFVYPGMDWMTGGDWYREVQLMTDRYRASLGVKAQVGEASVPTVIEVIGKNIDDQLAVIEQKSYAGGDSVNFDLFSVQPYYLRAQATDNAAATYYPSSLTLEGATPVQLTMEDMWNPRIFTINLLDKATAVDGIAAPAAAKQFFMLDGRRGQSRGLNIIRTNDGSVKKVLVK